MAAQIGSAVLLQYGVAGTQQPGSSVLLSYDQAVEVGVNRIRSSTGAPWVKAAKTVVNLFAPQPGTVRTDKPKDAPWGTHTAIDPEAITPWVKAARTDDDRDAAWGAFGDMLNEDQQSRWVKSVKTDAQREALWTAFGEMLNEDQRSKWKGSEKRDALKLGIWVRPRIQSKLPVPFVRPAANAVNFLVRGGGVNAGIPDGIYVAPIGNMLGFAFTDEPYYPPFYEALRASNLPAGNAAHFVYNPDFSLAFDEFGNPITEKAEIDPYKLVVWGEPRKIDNDSAHPWTRFSFPMNPGWGIPTEPGGGTGPAPGETITVPVQRVYIVLNEIQLLRVSNTTPISALTMNITFDCDSWLPQFTATIPESARDAIMPDPSPVEVEAIVNGVQFRFFVERIQRNRQFGQNTITIAGRGIACELDAPYAVASQWTNGTQMTAQQIINDTLTNTGYSQTWGITDWLVPANTFSQYGTPAQVAASVAEASGSVLQADWLLRDLRMMPRYPVKPWDWAGATPEYVIPGAVTQTESLEWIEKPSYNVVYVSGQQNGVLGQVKITGTAGDLAAPMFTHPLITHNDAARQKGISILGDTGRKTMLQLTMPVLPATGVIDVCRLIEFNDGSTTRRGIVRANTISVNWPTVRQTLTVEASA